MVDSSALLAIFLQEPESDHFLSLIAGAPGTTISAANVLETSIVLESRSGPMGRKKLDQFIHDAGIRIIPFDVVQLEAARYAYSTYGKGRHSAKLNYGDCFAYALAKTLSEPLLAKGDDFKQTDLTLA